MNGTSTGSKRRAALCLWLVLTVLPASLPAQADSSGPVEPPAGLDRVLEMADQAKAIFRDSIAPRPDGRIPTFPKWEVSLSPAAQRSPLLEARIKGLEGAKFYLRLPETVLATVGNKDAEPAAPTLFDWTQTGTTGISLRCRTRDGLALDGRVDAVGALLNWRLEVENMGGDTLSVILLAVSVRADSFPAFADSSFTSRLFLRSDTAWVSAADLVSRDSIASGCRSVVFQGENSLPGPVQLLLPNACLCPAGLKGNSLFLESVDRAWRLSMSASPAKAFHFDRPILAFGVDPGVLRLAPGDYVTLGGIISLERLRK